MLHPRSLLPALVAVAATALTGWSVPASAEQAPAPAAAEDAAPLAVTIDELSPATLPSKPNGKATGRITVTGSVTNVSQETWTSIDLYPLVSDDPLTTRAEIAAAALSDPTVPVGDRILVEGPYDRLDELQPGETLRYTVRVRARDIAERVEQSGALGRTPGVYWFGVHALGLSATSPPGDTTADGRARTFLPQLGGSRRPLETALVLPLRSPIQYDVDGSLADPATWASDLAADGELGRVVALGAAAGSRPLTWLADPALTDAVGRLAAGNPGRSLEATLDPAATEDPDALRADATDPSASPTDSSGSPVPSAGSSTGSSTGTGEQDAGDQPVEKPSADETAAAQAATTWLEDLYDAAAPGRLLALPYGDLDVAAATELDPASYARARRRAGATLGPWGLPTTPALTGPRGYLSPRTLELAGDDETLLGSDLMVPALGAEAPTVASVEGRTLILASSGASSGGPGPDPRLAGVAVRQRILAEAAVRRLSRSREPLVVVLPAGWSPGDAAQSAAFFAGLDQEWLDLSGLDDVVDRPATPVDPALIDYPESQVRRQLPATAFAAASALTRAGTSLQYLLTRNDTVGREVGDQALTSLSYAHRADAVVTRSVTERSRSQIDTTLRGVRIAGPPQVTLSSASGRFSATLENSLDQPVTVRVRALADEGITITMAEDEVLLAPRSRRSVLLTASSERQGIHRVTLQVTDLAGTRLGGDDELPIRAAQVSQVIWLIIATGAALLFGAIGVRLARRRRRSRRTPVDEAGDATATDPSEEAPTRA